MDTYMVQGVNQKAKKSTEGVRPPEIQSFGFPLWNMASVFFHIILGPGFMGRTIISVGLGAGGIWKVLK